MKHTLTLILLVAAVEVLAQPGAPPATPIDGGLSLLLLAGGAFGLRKLFQERNT